MNKKLSLLRAALPLASAWACAYTCLAAAPCLAAGAAQALRVANTAADAHAGLTAAQAQALVEAHNAIRAEVGVAALAWDAALAATAQQYVATLAKPCALRHSTLAYGENLAGWTADAAPTQAVALWADEKAGYRGAGGPLQAADLAAGHYTQAVWRGSTHIGCGRTRCVKDGYAWTLLSCNYHPAGNILGTPVY